MPRRLPTGRRHLDAGAVDRRAGRPISAIGPRRPSTAVGERPRRRRSRAARRARGSSRRPRGRPARAVRPAVRATASRCSTVSRRAPTTSDAHAAALAVVDRAPARGGRAPPARAASEAPPAPGSEPPPRAPARCRSPAARARARRSSGWRRRAGPAWAGRARGRRRAAGRRGRRRRRPRPRGRGRGRGSSVAARTSAASCRSAELGGGDEAGLDVEPNDRTCLWLEESHSVRWPAGESRSNPHRGLSDAASIGGAASAPPLEQSRRRWRRNALPQPLRPGDARVPVDELRAEEQRRRCRRVPGTGRTGTPCLRALGAARGHDRDARRARRRRSRRTAPARPSAPRIQAHHGRELHVAHAHAGRVGDRGDAAGSRPRRRPRSGSRAAGSGRRSPTARRRRPPRPPSGGWG